MNEYMHTHTHTSHRIALKAMCNCVPDEIKSKSNTIAIANDNEQKQMGWNMLKQQRYRTHKHIQRDRQKRTTNWLTALEKKNCDSEPTVCVPMLNNLYYYVMQ